MIRRPRRVVPSVLVAVVVLAAMVAVVVSCIQVLVGQQPLIPFSALATLGASVSWTAVAVLVTGGLLAVLGLVLLACAWTAGTPTVVPLAATAHSNAGTTRAGLRRRVTTTAGQVDGVRHARATVTHRRVVARVSTARDDASGLSDQVHDAVGEALTSLGLKRTPRIRVRVQHLRRS